MKKHIKYLFALTMGLCGLSSCSEETAESEEYANWQERNEQFLAAVANDSLKQEGWMRLKKYSLNPDTEGAASDYVYVKVIEQGSGTSSPCYTDSVRVIYQGRLIPSASYAKGYVFDGTVYGAYSVKTSDNSKQKVANTIDGYATALQHMHVGDYWRVYIPADLGYGATANNQVPAYSMLIFDLTLLDFSPSGQVMRRWR